METAWEAENDKDECIVNLEGPQRNYWLGSEAGMLGCYWFSGVVFAGDGSPADHKGRMGAGAYCLGDPDVQQCVGVGREEEGTSSNRPELAALVLALRKTRITDNLLYLCDNQSDGCARQYRSGWEKDQRGRTPTDNKASKNESAERSSDVFGQSEGAQGRTSE